MAQHLGVATRHVVLALLVWLAARRRRRRMTAPVRHFVSGWSACGPARTCPPGARGRAKALLGRCLGASNTGPAPSPRHRPSLIGVFDRARLTGVFDRRARPPARWAQSVGPPERGGGAPPGAGAEAVGVAVVHLALAARPLEEPLHLLPLLPHTRAREAAGAARAGDAARGGLGVGAPATVNICGCHGSDGLVFSFALKTGLGPTLESVPQLAHCPACTHWPLRLVALVKVCPHSLPARMDNDRLEHSIRLTYPLRDSIRLTYPLRAGLAAQPAGAWTGAVDGNNRREHKAGVMDGNNRREHKAGAMDGSIGGPHSLPARATPHTLGRPPPEPGSKLRR